MSGPSGWDDVPGATPSAPTPNAPAGAGRGSSAEQAPAGDPWGETGPSPHGWGPETDPDDSWGSTQDFTTEMPKEPAPSPGLLFGAMGCAASSVLLGVLLGRGSGPIALFAWFLAGFVSIALMALHQQQDLKAAMSVYYVGDTSTNMLRWITLGLVAVGVVLNSYFFAHWVATR